ncbi:MAG: hypothetical protein IJR59_04265, partial [Firmicutes bacterium]|nr:hypothetical protein [Bacillota bacterium]
MKHIVLPAYSHTCIYFDNFDILAYMMKDGQTDPTDTENTRYFDTDGNEIADVYEYISGRGAEPKDGIYAETICGVRQLRRFVKKTNYPGVPDMFAPSDRKVCPRMKIGNTGHYLCGNEVDKEGMGGSWIEDESGKDLYWRMLGNMAYTEIYALDTSEEKYLVKEHHLQGDMGYYQILDSDLNVIETGESFSCDPTGEGFITPINAEITVPEVEFNDDDFVDPEQMEVFFKDKIITGSADKDEPMIIQTEDDSEPISDVSQDLADVDPTAYLPSVLGWTFAVCGIFIIFALFMILKR